jgi:hypothetical protein
MGKSSQLHNNTAPLRDLLSLHRDDILRLAAEHGASNVRVFGSVARDEATPDSDIDLLVDQDWSKLSAWGGMGLVVALEDLLGRQVDLATPEELKPALRERILKEAVPL